MASARAAASVGVGTPSMIQPCLVTKYGSGQSVATFRNPFRLVDRARLAASGGQAELGADIAGTSKTRQVIDYRDIGKPHARNYHQASCRCVRLRPLSDGLSFAQAIRCLLAFLPDDRTGRSSGERRLDLTLRSRAPEVEQE